MRNLINSIISFLNRGLNFLKGNEMRINYKLISSTETNEKFNKRISKFCYYCGTTDKNKFKTIPHLTPELLTRNNNTYNYECDDCNQIFSGEYENHLTNFTRPFVVLSQCKTKKGYPKIKMDNGDSIQFKDGQLHIVNSHNSFPMEFDEERQLGSVKVPRKKYIPYKVYKALLKIAISLLPPEKIDNYSDIIEWIKRPELDDRYNLLFISKAYSFKLIGKKYNEPFAELYEAQKLLIGNHEYPQHILVIGFANFAIQIFLPPSKELLKIHDSSRDLGLELLPIVFKNYKSFPREQISITEYDLSVKDEIVSCETFHFTYQDRIRESQ